MSANEYKKKFNEWNEELKETKEKDPKKLIIFIEDLI
jgi:hypothetical protein